MHKQLARIVGIVFFLGLLAPSSWAAILRGNLWRKPFTKVNMTYVNIRQ